MLDSAPSKPKSVERASYGLKPRAKANLSCLRLFLYQIWGSRTVQSLNYSSLESEFKDNLGQLHDNYLLKKMK